MTRGPCVKGLAVSEQASGFRLTRDRIGSAYSSFAQRPSRATRWTRRPMASEKKARHESDLRSDGEGARPELYLERQAT
jgi:hypothetical protein